MRSMDAIGYLDFYEPSILPDGSRDAFLPSYKRGVYDCEKVSYVRIFISLYVSIITISLLPIVSTYKCTRKSLFVSD